MNALFLARGIECGDRDGLPSRCGHSRNAGVAVTSTEDDDVVSIPRSRHTIVVDDVAQGLRRATRNRDRLQFSSGKESDGAAIGRPERQSCTLSAGHRLASVGVQRADPETLRPIVGDPDKCQVTTVGGEWPDRVQQ